MTAQNKYTLPGLEVVGRGVYLRPYQPYELKDVIFKRGNTREYYSKETKKTYAIPAGYELNDSPPMPAERALNQVVIEESWERFEKQTSRIIPNVRAGSANKQHRWFRLYRITWIQSRSRS